MPNKMIILIITSMYTNFLRDMIIEFTLSTDNSLDDRLVGLLDFLLHYDPKG